MVEHTDLQIQLHLAKKRSDDATRTTHDVMATIDGSGSWRAESTIDYAWLSEAESKPRLYGQRLGELLFPPSIMNALRQARGIRERPVRIRLWLVTGEQGAREEQHGLRWERAFVVLNGKEWPLAITPELPFSRYLPAESVDPDPSDDQVFRLAVVFANPQDLLAGQQPVDVEADLSKLLDGLGTLIQGRRLRPIILPGRTGLSDALRARLAASKVEVIEGPSTIDAVTDAVSKCHGLHIVAHGTMNPQTQRGALLLENPEGRRAFAFDDDLNPWVHPNLRLVVLQACQSAAATAKDAPPFVGIGPKLVQLGVPAVVAMQDFVAMEDARVFAGALYRSLMRHGLVDVAVNEGRQAIFRKSANDNFSIPVLFMRLKRAQLWRPDPLHDAVVNKLAELGPQTEHSLPTRAILSLHKSLDYDPEAGPPGALFDTPAKLQEVSAERGALVAFVGPRGMAKGSQLEWLYRETARRFLEDEPGAAAPVLLTLREILEARSIQTAVDRKLAALAGLQSGMPLVSLDRSLLLLISGDAEVGEDALREGLQLLQVFRRHAGHAIVMTLDEGLRHVWASEQLEPTAVLVARPMDFNRVCQHLKRLGTPAGLQLHGTFEQRRCRDVACTPWLVERMIALSARSVTFDSRATLMRQIAGELLASRATGGVPRLSAERALEQLAWRMQTTRRSALGGGDVYDILAAVRGNREFRLGELKEFLIRSSILAPAEEDGVRFRYASLQAYYAAKSLAASPDRQRLLEDITASLGRLSRVRWWEETLVTLAGIDRSSSEALLGAILAGSSLIEGEQVYLAARCHLDTRGAGPEQGSIVSQIVDALIWRSHPGNLRPYADRKRAATALTELRHPNAIPHLVSLACDPIATGWGTEKRHEFSGIRLIAVNGLILIREAATAYVLEQRPSLARVAQAWITADAEGRLDGLIEELHRNDKATSPIAAFALGFYDDDLARRTLLEVFADESADGDVGWAVADTFATLDSVWVSQHVIEPRLDRFVDPRVPYLIGCMGLAVEGSRERAYLTQCFTSPIVAVQARALRALGALRDTTIRGLCEQVACDNWAAGRERSMNLPATLADEDRNRLRNAAMEALREVGDEHSIEALREARRAGGGMTMTLRQLSFDVAEDIYWRVTGGLSGESLDTRNRS